MLKNVTEKKNPTKSHKNCDLKKTYKNSQKFLELKKKSVVDNYSIHSNCFCVCFCLCLFRNFLWSSSTFFRKTILKKITKTQKNILVILHCAKTKRYFSPNVFFGNVLQNSLFVFFIPPHPYFLRAFAFSLYVLSLTYFLHWLIVKTFMKTLKQR